MAKKTHIPLWNMLPLSRIRLAGARFVSRALRIFLRKENYIVTRRGIRYEVDLTEGFDLGIFCFGAVQGYVSQFKYYQLPENATIIDIGANIGTVSLPLAKKLAGAKIFAIEPTDYACKKFLRNLKLNPNLAGRIELTQSFVSDQTTDQPHLQAFASWRVDKEYPQSHPVHGGIVQAADSVGAITLDDFCKSKNLKRLDLVKIDTDGHEFAVLSGGRRTLEKYRPVVIFEIGIYVMQEQDWTFGQFADYFDSLDYFLLNAKNGKPVNTENYLEEIPLHSTTDLLALPKEICDRENSGSESPSCASGTEQ